MKLHEVKTVEQWLSIPVSTGYFNTEKTMRDIFSDEEVVFLQTLLLMSGVRSVDSRHKFIRDIRPIQDLCPGATLKKFLGLSIPRIDKFREVSYLGF